MPWANRGRTRRPTRSRARSTGWAGTIGHSVVGRDRQTDGALRDESESSLCPHCQRTEGHCQHSQGSVRGKSQDRGKTHWPETRTTARPVAHSNQQIPDTRGRRMEIPCRSGVGAVACSCWWKSADARWQTRVLAGYGRSPPAIARNDQAAIWRGGYGRESGWPGLSEGVSCARCAISAIRVSDGRRKVARRSQHLTAQTLDYSECGSLSSNEYPCISKVRFLASASRSKLSGSRLAGDWL